MVLDHSFGEAALQRADVVWPGPDAAAAWLDTLHHRWLEVTDELDDTELLSRTRVRWPLTNSPFADLYAWMNVELMKNAAEIGYARFLYKAR